MADPVTISVIGGWVALEGIKFLYGQSAELLKAWRERKDSQKAGKEHSAQLIVPIIANDALDGTLTQHIVNPDVLDREISELIRLYGALAPYAQGIAALNSASAEVENQAGQLRSLLEAAYGQRLTFRGEQRDPTGTDVRVTQIMGDIAGDVVGIDADLAQGAGAHVHQQANSVKPGGTLKGFSGNIGR